MDLTELGNNITRWTSRKLCRQQGKRRIKGMNILSREGHFKIWNVPDCELVFPAILAVEFKKNPKHHGGSSPSSASIQKSTYTRKKRLAISG